MRRIYQILCLALVCALVLSACDSGSDFVENPVLPELSSSPSPSSAIVVPSGPAKSRVFGLAYTSGASFNPITGESSLNHDLWPLMYEGLFRLAPDFTAEPVLCESFIKEGLSYTLTLRSDVSFSDESPLTAADAAYSLNLARTGSQLYRPRYQNIAAVTALSEHTLRIDLSADTGRLEVLLTVPIIKDGSANMAAPPGTGPYVFVEDERGGALNMRGDWWQHSALPRERIELNDTPEADQYIYAFESGAVHVAVSDHTATNPVGFSGDYEEWLVNTSDMYYLMFNTTRTPLDRAAVRKAIGYAVDRERIVDSVMLRRALPSVIPASPVSPVYDTAFDDTWAYSLQAISEDLAAEGFEDSDGDGVLDFSQGKSQVPLTLDFIVNTENAAKTAAAQIIADDLRSVGVDVTLRQLKWDTFLSELQGGNFDLCFAEVRLTADFSLEALVTTGGALNYGKFSNADVDKLHADFLASGKGSAPVNAYFLYSRLIDEAPIVPILFKQYAVLTRRGSVGGIVAAQDNIFYSLTDWTLH
ncbi:ABC transporter substrate-binding protein [Oscillospiraceae bacterium OttesenSCG-928-F05]|nr:ABC transporter substrate-binding protein [Oscillospiraceae bacterium OttesenSCG-928-F05]